MRKLLFLIVFSIFACLQFQLNANEKWNGIETKNLYEFPIKEGLYKSVWTEDFDFAVPIALKENKLIFFISSPGGESYFGDRLYGGWEDSVLQKYIEENFICVFASVTSYTNTNSSRFAAKHFELRKRFKMGGHPAGAIFNPRTEKFTSIHPNQKTGLGLIDDLEIAKEKILKDYERKKVLDNPDAVEEPQPPKQGKFGVKINFKRLPLDGWADDIEKTLELAKKNKKMILICYHSDVENYIKSQKSLNTPEFKDFVKKNFECVKINYIQKINVGVYKWIRDYPAGKTKIEQDHIAFLKKFSVEGPVFLIYDPITGKVKKNYQTNEDSPERISRFESDIAKLKAERETNL